MVQPLRGLDAAFLYLETPATPLQVAQVCVFDPTTSPSGLPFDRVRALFEHRLPRLPPFRQRLVTAPLGIGHPVWADDPDFDLDQHLQPAQLAAPGDAAQLARFTEAFLEGPLDRSRPLWDMRIVEGLEGGMVAGVTKVHHSAIDGVSGAELTANLLDLEPEPPPDPDPAAWAPDPLPSPPHVLRRAAADWLGEPAALARAGRAAIGAGWRIRRLNRTSNAPIPPTPASAPRTRFNGAVGPRRRVGFATLELVDVVAVKDATDATINEVVLAVCAGALRSYLEEVDELPAEDLVAAVPISVRTEEARGTMGNRLSAMLVSLATSVGDPVLRLERIAGSSRRAKEQDRALGAETVADLTGAIPPVAGAWLGRAAATFQTVRPPVFNVMISNFAGPPCPLYCASARLVAPYPLGPLMSGAALNITLQSYLDALHVGIVSDPDIVPDADRLPTLLQESLEDLAKRVS